MKHPIRCQDIFQFPSAKKGEPVFRVSSLAIGASRPADTARDLYVVFSDTLTPTEWSE